MKTRIMADHIGWLKQSYSESRLRHDRKKYQPEDVLEGLTDEDFIICFAKVAAYSLRENEWGRFHIDAIGEIAYDTTAFDDLILQDEQK
jgi:hypothetical protein